MGKWADATTVFLAVFVSAQSQAYEQYVGAALLGVEVFKGSGSSCFTGRVRAFVMLMRGPTNILRSHCRQRDCASVERKAVLEEVFFSRDKLFPSVDAWQGCAVAYLLQALRGCIAAYLCPPHTRAHPDGAGPNSRTGQKDKIQVDPDRHFFSNMLIPNIHFLS